MSVDEAPPKGIAHRAGNDLELAAASTLEMVELDVHVHRGVITVRHAKVLRPTTRLFEQWYLLPRGTSVLRLEAVLEVVGPETELLVDLKCFTRGAARRILAALPPDRRVTVACRSWWVLRVARDRPGTTALRSCANRFQLWLALRMGGLGRQVGVTVHARLLDEATVVALRERTPHVYTWGFTGRSEAQALTAMGVTGLISDDPAWV